MRSLIIFFLLIQGLTIAEITDSVAAFPSIRFNKDSYRQDTTAHRSTARQENITGSITDYVNSSQSLPAEKIFLHLDRYAYFQGDTIWFKAYIWYGYEQIPDTVSKVLYVDLLDENGNNRLSKKYLISKGTSNGEFSPDSSIAPGRYILRAYTQWMQNRDTGEPFQQSIIINKISQNFQVQCDPVIFRNSGYDSLKINLRFFEVDPSGKLNPTSIHKIKYKLKVGTQLIDSGEVATVNTIEKSIGKSLAGIDEKSTSAQFEVSVNDKSVSYKKQFDIQVRESVDIQFFPEGGALVNGIRSRIAFKAIGPDGLSREVKGDIETGEGDVVTTFESMHKGMGSFYLKPETGKNYIARLLFNNRNYEIPLTKSTDEGCTISLSASEENSDPVLNISCSPGEINSTKFITGSTNGKIWFSVNIKLTKESSHVRIPIDLLPEGICRLTLLSSDFKPVCERLLYADKKGIFKIEIDADSTEYKTRSKVTLLIKTKNQDGSPIQAELSMAVTDKEQVSVNSLNSGINAYRLLESELRGNIEDAGYYFRGGICSDSVSLDLLLLTQGYREFTGPDKNITDSFFKPEDSFNISGRVVVNGSKSRASKYDYSKINLDFFCQSGQTYFSKFSPDSLGYFSSNIPLLYGDPVSILQATTARGRKLNAEIFLNEVKKPPKFPISMPEARLEIPAIENIRKLQTVIKTVLSKDPTAGFMSANLPEVVVTAKAKNWYLDFDKEAIKAANLDSLDPTGEKYESLTDLLIREFGAKETFISRAGLKTAQFPCISIDLDYYFPIYLVNGGVWFNAAANSYEELINKLKMVSLLNVNEIKKLQVLPPGEISWHYANIDLLSGGLQQSLIVIETYSEGYRGDPVGIKTFILDGLETPRQFYSPKYDNQSVKTKAFDGRAILLWEPVIRTDENGFAKVEFFTSDRKVPYQVIINGIEAETGNSGQCQAQINYTEDNLTKNLISDR